MADTKITGLTDLATLDNADIVPVVDDVAGTPITKKFTFTTLKSFLKTYFDTLYSKYHLGILENSFVKTYYNFQLMFDLWEGGVANDTTTTKVNWVKSSVDVVISPGKAFAQFVGTGADSIRVTAPFKNSDSTVLQADSTNIIIMDWWAKLPATSTGDINMGFGFVDTDQYTEVYNNSTGSGKITFSMRGSTGVIYATMYKNGVGVTNTDVSAGITNTNWNNFRIEYHIGTDAKFYINGTLVATLSGANMPTTGWSVDVGFGRSNTAVFAVTAPNFSMQMNP